jgi:poly-gamma-glutamate capsule biosynthesis protein CapA/YwtB (metallophosphatase superfamily)
VEFPLAVVTGLTNTKGTIPLAELEKLDSAGKLTVPCGVEVLEPKLKGTAPCVAADEIVDALEADQELVALLPPGLVEPATKVLPIAGDGPYGLFGPDLFGDPESRALPYPVIARTTGDAVLDAEWTTYDASKVWTMTSIGSLCSDRYAAKQAVTYGKGWDWVFGGGTAKYNGPPKINPNPPPGITPRLYVRPVETGNDGAVGAVQRRADVAIADHECPIMPTAGWKPNDKGRALVFAVPEAVVTEWQGTLGLDVVYLAANHMSDRGVAGIRSTIKLLDKHGIPHTGLGMNLDEALEPAFIELAGLKVGFVAWNDVGGVARADGDTAGVPWITKANVIEAVERARAGGADVVMCDPQWWGGVEYHDDLLPKQVKQLGWFDDAGCDHVVGAGTHVAGPMLLDRNGDDVRLVLASPGNYVFGQDFNQRMQEGVILEQVFRGVKLVNVRMHPYVIILGARPALTDPAKDGRYVLQRIWKNSELDYRN